MPPISYPKPLPTHIHHTSRPLSLSAARGLISTYLSQSTSSAHLHPDALLLAGGPTFSAAGGPEGGIVLSNLRRVEAGLRGEVLAPDPEALAFGNGAVEWEGGRKRARIEIEADLRDVGSEESPRKGILKRRAGDNVNGEVNRGHEGDGLEWQDRDEYEAEEARRGIETGEVGERNNFVAEGGDVDMTVQSTPGAEQERKPMLESREEKKVDKEARKWAKKERSKLEKKEKERARSKSVKVKTEPREIPHL